MVAFIDEHRPRFGVEPICRVITEHGWKIVPNTYWVAKKCPPSTRSKASAWRRCTVERLLREPGLSGARRGRAYKITTRFDERQHRPEDLIERRFSADEPNRLWVADLTYVTTHSGWVYAAFILDVFSRMGVGWQV